jgi:DNA-binding MarR family transcriptional regulator
VSTVSPQGQAGHVAAFPDTAALLPVKVTTGLAKVGIAMRHHAWAESGPRGLNPTQGQLLALLRAAGGVGLRVSELAERLAIAPATVSDSVTALARKRMVAKERDPADARAVVVFLTSLGQSEAQAAAGWPDLLLEAVGTLEPAEQATLYRALIKMVRSLQLRGRIPVSAMCVTCRFFQPNTYPGAAAPHHCALVDAPFGDAQLRLDCPEHEAAADDGAERAWAGSGGGEPRQREDDH